MDIMVYFIYLALAIFVVSIILFIKAGGPLWIDRLLGVALFFSILLFVFFDLGGAPYDKIIMESLSGDGNLYEAFSTTHIVSFLVYLILAISALFVVWWKNVVLPPILFIICWSFIGIGLALTLFIFIQEKFNALALCYWVITLLILFRCVKSMSKLAVDKRYKSPVLNFFNRLIAKTTFLPIWVIILIGPLYLIIAFILVLFGQDSHAMIKVFTETTTYTLSQKTHPPYLPYHGHYLCTVAAYGDPKIVKPIGYGTRHGHPILVNKQLQIANAFEELIQDASPKFHRLIRNAYDKYGYPLSEKIDTPYLSNLTYILMKPLEWFFLVVLYTFCIKPEEKISRQYS